MAKKILVDMNFNQNEIQNAVVQNLATAPLSPVEGQEYFNTTDHKKYIYANGAWVDETNQGEIYTFSDGIQVDANNNVTLKLDETVTALGITEDDELTIDNATTSKAGLIEIATDTEASTGTDEVRAINAKQLATKIGYSNLSIASGSANYLGYNNANGEISAKVDTTATSASTNLITSAAVYTGLDGKVDKLSTKPTAGTYTKLTINGEGQVTGGTDLEASDIPNLTLTKITDVTATASEVNVLDGITASTAELNILDGVTADKDEINVLDGITASTAELNIMDGVTVTTADINNVVNKIELTDLSIASGSADFLEYNNSNGQIGAKVDTTVTASSTNLVTSGAVKTAIDNAVASVIIPKASISAVSGLPTLVKEHVGWMYNFSAAFETTSDFVEGSGIIYPAGTNVVVVEYTSGTYKYDVFAGFVDTSSFITASSTDTLTNKTIDADDNTISDLELDNFKSSIVVNSTTGIAAVATASDDKVATEKAIAEAIEDFITASSTNTLTNKTFDANGTGNSISNLEVADFKSGDVVTSSTGIAGVSSASDSKLATEKAIASALVSKANKIIATNEALTPVSGVATWTITNTIGDADVIVKIKEVATGDDVIADVTCTVSTVTIKINATSAIATGTYKATIIG